MSNQVILYVMIGAVSLLVIMGIVYFLLRKKMNTADAKYTRQLRQGTETNTFSTEVMYQKLYMFFIKAPVLKRYLIKIRRRLEIINVEDEFLTRKQSAKALTKALLIVIPLLIAIIIITRNNLLLMAILLIFLFFMIETLIDGYVNKIDTKLLKEQIDFFAEIRHAYHEFNMVEEAIYQVAQDDELSVSTQAEKIYEVLISDDPESELEKYYDVAPNPYLKEFAGVSYLTKEFGDRKVDGASLYLKNVNNITQEMQLEILKRDKLDYVFQSLSFISVAPVLLIEWIKSWALSNFGFTSSFYNGKLGLIVQLLILLVTFVCYVLIRKIKDVSQTNANVKNTENPWQAKLYKKAPIKKFVDLFIPKKGTKEYRKITQTLKESASPNKIEWVYINRILIAVATFVVSLIMFMQIHRVAIKFIYEEPTTEYDLIGSMSASDEKKAKTLTESDNVFLDRFRGKTGVTVQKIQVALMQSDDYKNKTEQEIETAAKRIYQKLQVVNGEKLQPYELLFALVFMIVGYMSPIWILYFQKKMRQLEMEDEVMQFQTIILMLMKIERVNVEIILEWLERYANIFKDPITQCVNNYEAGPWEALEEMKQNIENPQLIRIVEGLQAAVEKIPIADAFDELDTERAYYQEKRKDTNEQVISRKGLIGKAIGFAPMIVLFVGYLIIPLVVIGFLSMTNAFNTMSTMY